MGNPKEKARRTLLDILLQVRARWWARKKGEAPTPLYLSCHTISGVGHSQVCERQTNDNNTELWLTHGNRVAGGHLFGSFVGVFLSPAWVATSDADKGYQSSALALGS